jgi:hypothetical protein
VIQAVADFEIFRPELNATLVSSDGTQGASAIRSGNDVQDPGHSDEE